MTQIQHRDIPNSQLHEPKDITTALNRQLYFANGSGSGAWRKLTEADIDYSSKTNNRFGWIDVADSQYTSGAPRSISSGVRTQLTNNGLGSQTDTTRLGALWDTTNNQFLINDLNGAYLARINYKVKAAAAAGTPYVVKLELESSNANTVIASSDFVIKGGNYENAISSTVLFYSGSFINNYPLKLYVTPDTNVTLYQTGFVVERLYKET